MSDVVMVAFISTFVPAIFGVIMMILTNRQNIVLEKLKIEQVKQAALMIDTKQAVVETKAEMVELKDHTNSKLDALLLVTAQSEFAKGLKQGGEDAMKKEFGPGGPKV